MSETRFFVRASKEEVGRIFALWDAAFEDEGAPVGMREIDEAADLHEVSIYFDDAEGDREAEVAAVLDAPLRARLEREAIPETDWMKQVLAELKPVRAGRFVVHGAHDRSVVRPNDLSIEIEAGQAFGTGHHGTTAGCLDMIDRIVRRRRPGNVLDLGTGTAVLAIGAAKLARVPVLATDIDPVAIAVARENIANNRVAGLVTAEVATGMSGAAIRRRAPFDLVVANILAGPLAKLAPAVARSLAPSGDVVLSGILVRQRNAVLAAYRDQHLYHRATITRGDWVTLHLKRG
ncbi:ribosomal protein L11 methyltransferase [Aureimonas endophytica]|uniref:Ribosomal protein L11 methyltransferase n=1 Tax=Aureimonas endophytica TaxID=2027858 RepID=A0A916ZEI9_9HYPH|nr:50S ribosomal protein L11 methyltransferase [Aureimonas endophytica]GGD92151.1 ribosomal protein L11 methyltransferase [Aureimonas endophytica]